MHIGYNVILTIHEGIVEEDRGQIELEYYDPNLIPFISSSLTEGTSCEIFYANGKYYVMFRLWHEPYGNGLYELKDVIFFVLWIRRGE